MEVDYAITGTWRFDKSGEKLIYSSGRKGRTGRKVGIPQIFEGPIFEYFFENFNVTKASGTALNEVEFRTCLTLLMKIMDSYHDWKGGRLFSINFYALLNCFNISLNFKQTIEKIYKKICKSRSGISCTFGKKNFEGDILNYMVETISASFKTFSARPPTDIDKKTEDLFFPNSLIKQADRIYNYFYADSEPSQNDYLIDAIAKPNLFKYLAKNKGSNFISNYYTEYDGAVGTFYTSKKPYDNLMKVIYLEEFDFLKKEKEFGKIQTDGQIEWNTSINDVHNKNMNMKRIYNRYTNKNVTSIGEMCIGTYGTKKKAGTDTCWKTHESAGHASIYKDFSEISISILKKKVKPLSREDYYSLAIEIYKKFRPMGKPNNIMNGKSDREKWLIDI